MAPSIRTHPYLRNRHTRIVHLRSIGGVKERCQGDQMKAKVYVRTLKRTDRLCRWCFPEAKIS